MIPSPPRVTFDSNAWEKVFDPVESGYAPVRAALAERRIAGFICEAAFRIEAIKNRQRPSYFAQPHMSVTTQIKASDNGQFDLITSMEPDDGKHPGIPPEQRPKLQGALAAGIRVLRGLTWMGLPRPPELFDCSIFIPEEVPDAKDRLERQLDAFGEIHSRGAGKAIFDAAKGWDLVLRTPAEEKKLAKACAEWADGELVAAHIGYQNELLCTDDRAINAGVSVFDDRNRAWLAAKYGVVFVTLDELMARVTP